MTQSTPITRPPSGYRVGWLGAVSWASVGALAAFGFASQNVSASGFSRGYYPYRELLGFASAFAVSGAVTGVFTLGILAGWRTSLAMGLVLASTQVAVYIPLWFLPLFAAPRFNPGEWAAMNRGCLLSSILPGVASGIALGLLVSAIGTGLALVGRRVNSWRLNLALASGGIVFLVVLVPKASTVISEFGIELRWKYGWSATEVMFGAGSGATTGAITGIITALSVARFSLRRSKPARKREVKRCRAFLDERRGPAVGIDRSPPPALELSASRINLVVSCRVAWRSG
jgi:hypothetical protein